jgi:hypothetical protein
MLFDYLYPDGYVPLWAFIVNVLAMAGLLVMPLVWLYQSFRSASRKRGE